MKEIWKDIEGFEGFYQISNFGNIKSLARLCGTSRKKYTCKERILKLRECKGYYTVQLFKDGKPYQFRCNRLVAQAFIPNPDNLPCINHKDENKKNNRVDNLKWCTVAYNSNYGTVKDKIRQYRLGKKASLKTKQKMSVAHSGSNNAMYGKHHTLEAKKKISINIKKLWKEGKYNGKK